MSRTIVCHMANAMEERGLTLEPGRRSGQADDNYHHRCYGWITYPDSRAYHWSVNGGYCDCPCHGDAKQ